jgi:Putative Ig domain/Subtilase family
VEVPLRLRHVLLTLLGVTALVTSTASPRPAAQAAAATPAAVVTSSAPADPDASGTTCDTVAQPHLMSCFARRRTGTRPDATPFINPSGYSPAQLRDAYKLPSTGGSGATIAIVDAYDSPSAEADLAVYRSRFGLSECSTANGCFQKVNQFGAAAPLPRADGGWANEISLDLDMASAICPACHLLLVTANSNWDSDLYLAEDYAAAHAGFISNSWGGAEYSGQTRADGHFNHPGVVITASTGDLGAGASYPATSRYVVAVGGTTLTPAGNGRGWIETAWAGAGSGCSGYDAKPSWQTISTGCAGRAEADVAAVADPSTGVAVYQTYGAGGWVVYGGTSAAAPIIAGVYALAGTPGRQDYPAAYPYAHPSALFDVTGGSNGTCAAPLCTAGPGWDGPTGLGTPNGLGAFTSPDTPVIVVDTPNPATGTVGTAVGLTMTATGATSLGWSASGLPPGLALNSTTGVIAGTPTTAGSFTVTVTATSGAASGRATFGWTINPAGCTGTRLPGNPGFETGRGAPWSTSSGVISSVGGGQIAHSGSWYAWLDGYGTSHTDTLSQPLTVPASCRTATLTFWLRVNTEETTTSVAYDKLTVRLGGSVVASFSNLSRGGYRRVSLNLTGYRGRTVLVSFLGTEDRGMTTSFIIDDTALVLA